MKAISLCQPWASLWVWRLKKNETRSWPFPYGSRNQPVAIHAAKKIAAPFAEVDEIATGIISDLLKLRGYKLWSDLPTMAIIGWCDGIESKKIVKPPEDKYEYNLGDWRPGRYAWMPNGMRTLESPIHYKGRQGIFNIPDEIIFGGGTRGEAKPVQAALF